MAQNSIKHIAAALVLLFAFHGRAQSEDSLRMSAAVPNTVGITTHSVSKALWLSTALPGAGQIYNRKYWKAPLIWAGLATTIWFAQDNNKVYRDFATAYDLRVDDDPNTVDAYVGVYSERQLIVLQNQFRRWRDLNIILTVGVYLYNILDAYVDAHLFYFDVSEDLSLHWRPHSWFTPGVGNGQAVGVSITLFSK